MMTHLGYGARLVEDFVKHLRSICDGYSPRRKEAVSGEMDPSTDERCTRRNFIKRALAASRVLGFATGCRRLQVTDRNGLSRAAIERLRAKLKGRLILPTDPPMKARRVFCWNAATERRLRVIVQRACEEDALRSVEFARRHDLEAAVRAAGTVTWAGDVRTARSLIL